jgi:ATP-binding cassette, subfamily C (CFTR/MRP), member 1
MDSIDCSVIDDTWGPSADACRGGFDFTLLFEEAILTLFPLCLFLLSAPVRAIYLSHKSVKVKGSVLLPLKLVRTNPSVSVDSKCCYL